MRNRWLIPALLIALLAISVILSGGLSLFLCYFRY